MGKGLLIAAAKALAIVVAQLPINPGVAEFFVRLGIGRTAGFHVHPCSFKAIVKALPLHFAEFLWGRVPAAVIPVRAILRVLGMADEKCGCSQRESKRCQSDSRMLHGQFLRAVGALLHESASRWLVAVALASGMQS